MTRPLRIQFPGAVYHVTSRGDRQEPIFDDNVDRWRFMSVVDRVLQRCDASVLAFCLMGNHYHFVLQTRRANLSSLMQQINGIYSQAYNRRHELSGHLLQGRFKAILVDRESYLLEVCRYVELNPVRAGLVQHARDWPWSSYRAHCLMSEAPAWLDVAGLHRYLLGREASTPTLRRRAGQRYAELVAAARDIRLWEQDLRRQIFLGDEAFVERMQAVATQPGSKSRQGLAKAALAEARTLRQYLAQTPSREEALWLAHSRSAMTMTRIGQELGLSTARVSQLIKKGRQALSACPADVRSVPVDEALQN